MNFLKRTLLWSRTTTSTSRTLTLKGEYYHSRNTNGFRRTYSQTEGGKVYEFDPKLLEHIVCPLSKTKLRYDAAKQELISDEVGLAFPINNGIPILLPESGRIIDQAKFDKLKERKG